MDLLQQNTTMSKTWPLLCAGFKMNLANMTTEPQLRRRSCQATTAIRWNGNGWNWIEFIWDSRRHVDIFSTVAITELNLEVITNTQGFKGVFKLMEAFE
jgi:hypothetical protein